VVDGSPFSLLVFYNRALRVSMGETISGRLPPFRNWFLPSKRVSLDFLDMARVFLDGRSSMRVALVFLDTVEVFLDGQPTVRVSLSV